MRTTIEQAMENVETDILKLIDKKERKLESYADREKVYGYRYEEKKDLLHEEISILEDLMHKDGLEYKGQYEKLRRRFVQFTYALEELCGYKRIDTVFLKNVIRKYRLEE